METLDCIKGRRSIRAFKNLKIPEQLLYNVLEAAVWAPSSGNLQSTRLIVVTDKTKKNMMVKTLYDQRFIAQAPVVIIVCADNTAIKREYGERGPAKSYAIQNSAIVAQNIMLAAHNQGLASCWVAPLTETRIRKEFEIPANIQIHAIIPIGYPAEWPRPPARIPLADITFFKKWGEHKAYEELWPLEESAPRIAKTYLSKAQKSRLASEALKKLKKTASKVKRKLKRKK